MLCDFTQKGDIDKTMQLLDAGCPVNAADYDGRTALHLACSEGNLQIVAKLVERSAELNPLDRWVRTPRLEGQPSAPPCRPPLIEGDPPTALL